MALSLSIVGTLFGANSGSSNLTSLVTGGGTTSSGTTVASAGAIKSALVNAEKNLAKQMEQVAKDPTIQRELARYEKVVKSAKSLDDVLDDPVARKVFMTASGLKAYADYPGMAKKVLMSDPDDKTSQAAKLSSINGAWYDTVKNFDFAAYGVDRLSPKMDGFAGRWRISVQREGETVEAELQLKRVQGVWKAEVDGLAQPVTVSGDSIELNLLWRDSTDEIRTSILKGTLNGERLSGTSKNDGETTTTDWSAAPYFAGALNEVKNNYLAEKRLDMLDAQLPGLGSAVLFKQVAGNLKNAVDILGSPLGREIITTAFNIPKQIAIQSIEAQEKAINQRMNPAKLQDKHFVDMIAQRYLLMLNGGLGGITA